MAMPGIVTAWAVGEGIIIYHSVHKRHAPPMPGQLLASSGLFVMLALLAEADGARGVAAALAWGFDAAAFLNLWPSVTGGGAGPTPATAAGKKSGSTGNPIGEAA